MSFAISWSRHFPFVLAAARLLLILIANSIIRYLSVVVKAWAERPESSDEEEESESDHVKDKPKSFARKLTKRVKSTRNKDHDKGAMKTNRRRSLFTRRSHAPETPVSAGLYSDTENQVDKAKESTKTTKQMLNPLRKTQSNPISASMHSKDGHQNGGNQSKVTLPTSVTDAQGLSNKQSSKTIDALVPSQLTSQSISEDEVQTDNETRPNNESKAARKRVMELILRGTARAVGRLQHRVKMPKFNFEKYISYLQNVIPTIGFKIMGIIVTWNMVSTLLFLEVSLLALFVQESIFGNQKAKVSL